MCLPSWLWSSSPSSETLGSTSPSVIGSSTLTLNTGAPQGCELSPHDCLATHSSNTIIKFADDTTVIEEVRALTSWCQDNNLHLNVGKTKELIADYRQRQGVEHAPLSINGTAVNLTLTHHTALGHFRLDGTNSSLNRVKRSDRGRVAHWRQQQLIMGFTTIATTQASHITALKNSGCSYNLNVTRPSLHGHSAPGLDNNPTLPWLGSTLTGVPDPESAPAQPDDPWVTMGAKPKIIASSTPYQAPVKSRSPQGGRTVMAPTTPCKQEQRIVTRKDKHCAGHPFPPHPPRHLQLSNRFDILNTEDFPPLETPPLNPVAKSSTSAHRRLLTEAMIRRSSGVFTGLTTTGKPCPMDEDTTSLLHPTVSSIPHTGTAIPRSPRSPKPGTPLRPLISPTTLIIWDSIMRNIRFINAVTHCFPGTMTPDIICKLPGLIASLPTTIKRIIVHVGSNDTSRQQSELTKADFIGLFDLLNSTGKSAFISGPIPTLGRGIGRFSRILSLHTWLQSVWSTHNIGFIHNFNLFWNRSPLFAWDGLHPSSQGSRMLAGNLQHGVLFY